MLTPVRKSHLNPVPDHPIPHHELYRPPAASAISQTARLGHAARPAIMSQQPRGSVRNSADTYTSFPNPVDITDRPGSGARALSITSSRMTDNLDEDGDEMEEPAPMSGASPKRQPPTLLGRVQGLTGPVGEPGVPPSRPSTAATGKSGVASQAAYTKHMPSVVGGPSESQSPAHMLASMLLMQSRYTQSLQ
jgi:hypothetical protein